MARYFEAFYYDSNMNDIVETKDIFAEYQDNNHGFSTFPEYMEYHEDDYITMYARCNDLCESIESCASDAENNIDELRELLDELEDAIDHREEDQLKWEMVEVLE